MLLGAYFYALGREVLVPPIVAHFRDQQARITARKASSRRTR